MPGIAGGSSGVGSAGTTDFGMSIASWLTTASTPVLRGAEKYPNGHQRTRWPKGDLARTRPIAAAPHTSSVQLVRVSRPRLDVLFGQHEEHVLVTSFDRHKKLGQRAVGQVSPPFFPGSEHHCGPAVRIAGNQRNRFCKAWHSTTREGSSQSYTPTAWRILEG